MIDVGSVDQRMVDLNLRPQPLRGGDVTTLSGRTRVAPSELAGALNIIFIGQSTNSNSLTGTPESIANGDKIFNLSIGHRGACFVVQNPLLSSDIEHGHHGMYLADRLISSGKASKVILTNIIVGGNYFSDWAGSGELAYRIGLTARCIANAGLSGIRTIVDHQGGEWDSDAGISQSSATASLNATISEFKRVGILRNENAMIVHQNTRITNNSTLRNPIRAAQASVADGNMVIVGADIDTLNSSYRYDGTHFTESGGKAQADLKLSVYSDILEI